MRSVANATRTRSAMMIVYLSVAGIACSNGDGNDDATAKDADGDADRRVGEDADAGVDSEDVGVPPEAGVCGCSYGFHQECAEDELCMQASLYDERTCARAAPRGGAGAGACSTTSTASSAECNAQCAPSMPHGSPCGQFTDEGLVEAVIESWERAINNAALSSSSNEWEGFRQEDIQAARSAVPALSRECVDFLGWTMLGVVELCRGGDAVRHPESWDRFEDRTFKVLRDPNDECQISAGNLCMVAIARGVTTGTVAANRIDNAMALCPNGLPSAAPCSGPDAYACVKARLRTIIRPLYFQ